MNLELPFVEVDPSELDAFLAEIDRALDSLFLGHVEAALERAKSVPECAAAETAA